MHKNTDINTITIKNIKYSEFMSHETFAFECTVYRDGKPWCIAHNEGQGGETCFDPIKHNTGRELNIEIAAFNDQAPVIYNEAFESDIKQGLEQVVKDLLTNWLIERDLKKHMKKITLYAPAENTIYSIKNTYKPEMQAAIKNRHPDYIILNSLPFAEALVLYKKASA